MLTFEQLQRPGQGMQHSRSSTAFLAELLGSNIKQTRNCVKSSMLCSPPEVDLIHTVCHIYAVIGKCSHLSCCRDKAKACSAPYP